MMQHIFFMNTSPRFLIVARDRLTIVEIAPAGNAAAPEP